ncbi:hypothetical protein M409DRAFT_20053 [Zasmidium cellare ATCC 36951]|uniref:Uncharacterized protein n=1 Tax=Zasmidium cellare ATCC 36951 TaxID=1080233 RepID=A0A6A6CU02_ZASCE|nr:uncharacterized protein M409DRAFT_20053 [Zasmidium cellare ATCC 36951]KAF2169640.1 hypothetical protein M409DRAFT_20053 [Zasmidium cellare ATCC 36951]
MSQNQNSRPFPTTTKPPQQSQQPKKTISAAESLLKISKSSNTSLPLEYIKYMDTRPDGGAPLNAAFNSSNNFRSAGSDYNTLHHDQKKFYMRVIGDIAKADRSDLIEPLLLFMPTGWRTRHVPLPNKGQEYILQSPDFKCRMIGRFPDPGAPAIEWDDWIEECEDE